MHASHTPHAGSGVPHGIHNPISGEKIIVRTSGVEAIGELLVFDLFVPPGRQVPSRHAHPNMEETFTILQGVMLFKLGHKTILAHPEAVTTPADQQHAAMASCLPEHLIATYSQGLAPGSPSRPRVPRLFAYLFWR